MESAKQAAEHAEGKRSDLRTATLPLPPKALESREIVQLRKTLNFSSGLRTFYCKLPENSASYLCTPIGCTCISKDVGDDDRNIKAKRNEA